MWAQLSFPVHIDQTSDLSFLLRRLYSFSSIVIFFSPSAVCCSSMKDQKNIFNIFLCFTTLLLRKAISRHGKNPIIWYISVQSFIIPFHLSWVDFFQLLRNYMYHPIVILFLKALHIISTLQPGRDGTILIWHRGPKDIRILRKVQHVQALRNPFLDWKRSFWKNE